jgi:hypothetical protein
MKLITHLTPKTTTQELFDYVTSFLLKQGEQSRGLGGACTYRGLNGLMCAAGCVIPDEFYRPAMEGDDIVAVFADYRHRQGKQRPFWKALAKHEGLLVELQEVHDSPYKPATPDEVLRAWIAGFQNIAKKRKLTFDAPLLAEDDSRP